MQGCFKILTPQPQEVVCRRSFLRGATALGFGMIMRTEISKGAPRPQGSSVRTNSKTAGGRGTTQRVTDEIKESKDPETGARVRRLTADGSDNVHIYFTSESFLADGGSDKLIFASNRSGRFQYHLLDIPTARQVQLTDGDRISPNMGCVDPTGRLFYFDGPVLRACRLDTMQDRELYRVPDGTRPSLPTCTCLLYTSPSPRD